MAEVRISFELKESLWKCGACGTYTTSQRAAKAHVQRHHPGSLIRSEEGPSPAPEEAIHRARNKQKVARHRKRKKLASRFEAGEQFGFWSVSHLPMFDLPNLLRPLPFLLSYPSFQPGTDVSF